MAKLKIDGYIWGLAFNQYDCFHDFITIYFIGML